MRQGRPPPRGQGSTGVVEGVEGLAPLTPCRQPRRLPSPDAGQHPQASERKKKGNKPRSAPICPLRRAADRVYVMRQGRPPPHGQGEYGGRRGCRGARPSHPLPPAGRRPSPDAGQHPPANEQKIKKGTKAPLTPCPPPGGDQAQMLGSIRQPAPKKKKRKQGPSHPPPPPSGSTDASIKRDTS